MYNINTLKTSLAGWIGFKDSEDSAIPSIDSSLKTATSGMYWSDFYPLITTDILYYVSPQFNAMNFATWGAGTTYATGDKVLLNGVAWKSKTGGNIGHLPASGSYWESMFSDWLEDRVNASIANMFNRLAIEKKLNESTKSIFENKKLFLGSGLLTDTITPNSRFVGIAIRPKNINNIRITIDNIGLQFTQIQTDLPIYLFNSQSQTYIKRQLVSTTSANKFDWIALTDFDLDFVNIANDIDSGSTWYIGYFEDDIIGNAINKPYSWIEGPCKGCPGSLDEYSLWNLWSRFYTAQPAAFTTLDGTNLPSNVGYSTSNYGLNLSFSVKPDVTEIFTANKAILTYPLGLQFAADMMQWILHNPPRRTSPVQGNIQAATIAYDLNDTTNSHSIQKLYDKALKGLSFDFSSMSQALPNNKPSSITYRAI